MPAPQAFLAIEKTMATSMRAVWDKRAHELLETLHPLIAAKKWGDAQTAVNGFTLAGVVTDVKARIEELAVSALLFGAHHATGSVKDTSFVKGKAIPQELHHAIGQLVHMVESNGRDYVCKQLHQEIEALKRADAASHLQKDGVYDEPSKRPDEDEDEEDQPVDPDESGATARAQEKLEPYAGQLVFGPEMFQEIKGSGFNPDDLEEEVLKLDSLFKADESLADRLNAAVRNGGTVAIDTGAGLTTSRLVSLGFLSEAVDRGVDKYVVNEVLDDRTCPVCQYMHGKTFDVARQYARVVQQLSSSDPDDLKSLAPWPGQSRDDMQDLYGQSIDEMQDGGLGSPPYHPGCRGMLMRVGEAQEDIPLGGGDLAEASTAGIQLPDFGGVTDDEDAAEGDLGDAALPTPEEEARDGSDNGDNDGWDSDKIDKLKWERFDVTDPGAFADVDAAFENEDYDQAQQLIDDWKTANGQAVSKHDPAGEEDPEDEESSPNAPKKKGKRQNAAGLSPDYDDIAADSSSTAVAAGTSNDNGAPLDDR